jgi:superfamily II DNA/RNA helicase
VLIATDVASRGIDIEQLPYVVNFDLPRSPNDYIHRIGRTGRAGQQGQAIALICPDEYAHFQLIEKRMKKRLPREQVAGFEVGEI